MNDLDKHNPPSDLKSEYDFENYIEGRTNTFAYNAGKEIAKNPGKESSHNPFFIFGACSVGKTHLCHAIGLRAKQMNPEMKILYISANLFKQQFETALKDDDTNSFLNFYQKIELLIIDDIQEFASKPELQNYLVHIFNFLKMSGKQLIFTSDQPPAELKNFEERLYSRLKGGVAVKIEIPDFELRKAISIKKINKKNITIPEEVVNFVVEKVTDIRSLEHVISSFGIYSKAGKIISMELAKEVVSAVIPLPKTPTPEKIRTIVCEYLDISEDLLMSKSRRQDIVCARQISMYLCKKHTNCNPKLIGSKIGNCDRATVVYSCEHIEEQIKINKKLKNDIDDIENNLKRWQYG